VKKIKWTVETILTIYYKYIYTFLPGLTRACWFDRIARYLGEHRGWGCGFGANLTVLEADTLATACAVTKDNVALAKKLVIFSRKITTDETAI
jgi:hypothetical protein